MKKVVFDYILPIYFVKRPWPTGGYCAKNKNICLWFCGCNFIV